MDRLLQQLDHRQLRLLLIGTGMTLFACALVYAAVPPTKEYFSIKKTAVLLEEVSEVGGELKELLSHHGAKIEVLEKQLHGDMADLPPKQIESYIIGKLQRISWKNDVEMVSVQPSVGENVQIFSETLFDIQLDGRYGNLYQWLWETRNELGFIVIKKFALRRSNNQDENPILTAEINLASYRAEQ